MRPYQNQRAALNFPIAYRDFRLGMYVIFQDWREAEYLGRIDNAFYYECLQRIKWRIRHYIDNSVVSSTARQRNRLLKLFEPFLFDERSGDGGFLDGALEGVLDIVLANDITS